MSLKNIELISKGGGKVRTHTSKTVFKKNTSMFEIKKNCGWRLKLS